MRALAFVTLAATLACAGPSPAEGKEARRLLGRWTAVGAFDADGKLRSGDLSVSTIDGRGGRLNHGSHEIRRLGCVPNTIDRVHGELLADRCPDYFVVR